MTATTGNDGGKQPAGLISFTNSLHNEEEYFTHASIPFAPSSACTPYPFIPRNPRRQEIIRNIVPVLRRHARRRSCPSPLPILITTRVILIHISTRLPPTNRLHLAPHRIRTMPTDPRRRRPCSVYKATRSPPPISRRRRLKARSPLLLLRLVLRLLLILPLHAVVCYL